MICCISANQRIERTDEDGSYWQYGYDSLGQVTNAVRRWSDAVPVSGQDYRYTYEEMDPEIRTSG